MSARININPYVDRGMVETIYKQLGMRLQSRDDEPEEDIES
jgi:hypothetical protein